MLHDPATRRQALRYVAVGVLGYGVQLASFALLFEGAGMGHLAAGIAAGVIAIVHNFVLHRHWTFEAGAGQLSRQARSYTIVSAVVFAGQIGVLHGLVLAGVGEVPAEALSVLAIVPVNFFAQRRFSFGR